MADLTRTDVIKLIALCPKNQGLNLTGVNLFQVNLSWLDLNKANLSGATLTGANLKEANLTEADLRNADLRKADLREADLSWADLSEANLTSTNLTEADLTGIKKNDMDIKTISKLTKQITLFTLIDLSNATLNDVKNSFDSIALNFINLDDKEVVDTLSEAIKYINDLDESDFASKERQNETLAVISRTGIILNSYLVKKRTELSSFN